MDVILGNQWFVSPHEYDQGFGQALESLKRGLRPSYCVLCKTCHTEDQFSSKGTCSLFCHILWYK